MNHEPVRILPHRIIATGRKAKQPPFTCDPVAHAEQNERAAREPLDLAPGLALAGAVAHAINELEGQGARSDRIADQLQLALDRYLDNRESLRLRGSASRGLL